MERKAALAGTVNGYIYEITVPEDRPADHYTPRIVANHCHATIPAEEAHIKWYRWHNIIVDGYVVEINL